jgi:hypothetical protein
MTERELIQPHCISIDEFRSRSTNKFEFPKCGALNPNESELGRTDKVLHGQRVPTKMTHVSLQMLEIMYSQLL